MKLTRVRLFAYIVSALVARAALADVRNPSVFVGEVVNGATAGAPLITSATGKVASGISFLEVTATAVVTTTSTADVLMTTMTETPAAGTWLVNFSTWCSHSNGNDTITMSLYFNGTQKTDSVRTLIPFDGAVGAITQDMPVSINAIVAANGTNPVQIEWHTNGGTATCTQRTLDMVRIQ